MLYNQNSIRYKRYLVPWFELRCRRYKALGQEVDWLLKHGPKIAGAITKIADLAYPRLQAAFQELRHPVAQQLRLRPRGSFRSDEQCFALVDCIVGLWYRKFREVVWQWREATHVELSSLIRNYHSLLGKGKGTAYKDKAF